MRLRHRAPASVGRPEGAPTDAGMTLVEVLAAVIIMGLVFTTVLTGIFTTVKITEDSSRKATADRLARVLAEDIKSNAEGAPFAYRHCGGNAYPYTPPPPYEDWRVSVEKVEYWRGNNPATWSEVCVGPGGGLDFGMQRFTILAMPPPGRAEITQRITVVKRDPGKDVGAR